MFPCSEVLGSFNLSLKLGTVSHHDKSENLTWKYRGLLELEFHLDLKHTVLIMFATKEWRMKIQTEQNKPRRKPTSIAQEFTVSFTTIISGVKPTT